MEIVIYYQTRYTLRRKNTHSFASNLKPILVTPTKYHKRESNLDAKKRNSLEFKNDAAPTYKMKFGGTETFTNFISSLPFRPLKPIMFFSKLFVKPS